MSGVAAQGLAGYAKCANPPYIWINAIFAVLSNRFLKNTLFTLRQAQGERKRY
jgi:hypothetical protein